MSLAKFAADLSGDHLDLPPEVDPDYVVQVHIKATGREVQLPCLLRESTQIRWMQWAPDSSGYYGHWEPYEVPEDTYRAVVIW